MFERYTDRARRVVVLAQDQARALNHNYIGTEHVLLGLVAEGEGVAALTLADLGVTLEEVTADVITVIGKGQSTPSGHIPSTPRCKKVLELGLREALQLGHNYIGTEHLLLGLIREGEGVAAQVLVARGVALSDARQAVIDRLSGYERAEAEARRAEAEARRAEAEARRAEAEKAARAVCICGHVYLHHELWQGCHWRGCGCPQFIVTEAVSA